MTDAAALPDLIVKFEGELTPEQVAMFRAVWEAATDPTEPEGFRIWRAGAAHGRAEAKAEYDAIVRGLIAQAQREARAEERKAIVQAMRNHEEPFTTIVDQIALEAAQMWMDALLTKAAELYGSDSKLRKILEELGAASPAPPEQHPA